MIRAGVTGYKWVQGVLLIASGTSLLAMMAAVTGNALLRNFFNTGIPASFEITEHYLMPLAIFLAMPYAYDTFVIPRLSFVIDRAPERVRLVVHIAVSALEIVMLAVLTFYTYQAASRGAQTDATFAAAGELWPVYPAMFLAPLAFGLCGIQVVLSLARSIKSRDVVHDTGASYPVTDNDEEG